MQITILLKKHEGGKILCWSELKFNLKYVLSYLIANIKSKVEMLDLFCLDPTSDEFAIRNHRIC